MAITFTAYLDKMRRVRGLLDGTIGQSVEEAMGEAVRATMDATPPKADTGRGPYIGTNTVTGRLKAAWATDSIVKPRVSARNNGYTTFSTWLKNHMEYASYVNDGHRMDRHFVPGLYINPESGLLEYDPSKDVGLVVGTKTHYVKGEFMTDKGREAYRAALENILGARVKELLTR